ncbi:MAG: homoserine dehydrogenase [Deltaproteobacteria bacterium]|nr:homoserine dehydrogenase [Deltaproteobacteria bacterium]
MSNVIRFALLGCGTVGSGVVELTTRNAAYLATRVGAPLELARVAVRDASKARAAKIDPALLTTDVARVLEDSSIDIVVEVVGGEEPAGSWIGAALRRGKSVVTANKSLLAARGPQLLSIASEHRADLAFEASVGGAVPIIRTLRDHLVADWVRSLRGIVNGTCNYILTRMRDESASFESVLAAAQELGYAEAEPSLDVDGHDAAHKLCVLALLAFGASVRPEDVPTEGIRAIEPVDHRFAARFGYGIKHLAVGRETAGRELDLRVHPALVPLRMPLASVDGVLNAIALEADGAGSQVLVGRGAGSLPTAVSVVADLIDCARNRRAGVSGLQTIGLDVTRRPIAAPQSQEALWYLRMRVADRPGVLAQIAGALGAHEVSIEQMVQEGGGRRASDRQGTDDTRVIVMLTHEAVEANVRAALLSIDAMSFVHGRSLALRVEG